MLCEYLSVNLESCLSPSVFVGASYLPGIVDVFIVPRFSLTASFPPTYHRGMFIQDSHYSALILIQLRVHSSRVVYGGEFSFDICREQVVVKCFKVSQSF